MATPYTLSYLPFSDAPASANIPPLPRPWAMCQTRYEYFESGQAAEDRLNFLQSFRAVERAEIRTGHGVGGRLIVDYRCEDLDALPDQAVIEALPDIR